MTMTKLPDSGHITPEEYAERTDLDIREVWRRLEDGRLPAVALCEWGDEPFDYWPINSEVVRALVAGRPVDYDPLYGGIRRIDGDKGLIRVIVSPELTPELYDLPDAENNRAKKIVARHKELKEGKHKSPTKQVAEEFSISETRVRQHLRSANKKTSGPLTMVTQLLSKK